MAAIKRKATARKLPTRTTRGTTGGDRPRAAPRRKPLSATTRRKPLSTLESQRRTIRALGHSAQSLLKSLGASAKSGWDVYERKTTAMFPESGPLSRRFNIGASTKSRPGIVGPGAIKLKNLATKTVKRAGKTVKQSGKIAGLRKRPKRAPKGGR